MLLYNIHHIHIHKRSKNHISPAPRKKIIQYAIISLLMVPYVLKI